MTGQQPAVVAAPRTTSVLTPTDFAQLGAKMAGAGFDEDQITAFLANLEERARQKARDLVIESTSEVLGLLTSVHTTTAMTIYQQLNAKQQGILGGSLHAQCAQIALNVAQQPPRRR